MVFKKIIPGKYLNILQTYLFNFLILLTHLFALLITYYNFIDNITISNKTRKNPRPTFKLRIKKYRESHYYRALCFSYYGTRIIYRYPLQIDNDEFIPKLCSFIELDLTNNNYHNLKPNCNTYFVGLVDGEVQFEYLLYTSSLYHEK